MTAPTLRWAVLVGLLAVGLWALGSVVTAELAQLSFEPTDASEFQAWAARPLLTAGEIALVCCGAGLVGWFISRRRRSVLPVAAAAAVVAASILIWGEIARAARSHPEVARARALASLVMPAGYAGSETRVDHPDAITAPAATRSWTATAGSQACADLHDRLVAWADPGTVRGPAGNVGGRCYWSAAWHRHAVDANVVRGPGDGATVSVRLAG